MAMRILICGDSYCVTDPDYAGMHWSEKLTDQGHDVVNLAYGGCSNALIALQFLHGLEFDPDLVIFSFTTESRLEFDLDRNSRPLPQDPVSVSSHIQSRYITNLNGNMTTTQKLMTKLWMTESSRDLEKFKSYFNIGFCLMLAQHRALKFCFSLGGFEYQHDWRSFLQHHSVPDILAPFGKHELRLNLWPHSGSGTRPWFHVDDDAVHTEFARECLTHV